MRTNRNNYFLLKHKKIKFNYYCLSIKEDWNLIFLKIFSGILRFGVLVVKEYNDLAFWW
jgi:hypothetical protein